MKKKLHFSGNKFVPYNRSLEPTAPVIMRLSGISQILLYSSKCYELWGIVRFYLQKSKLRNTIIKIVLTLNYL